MGAALSEAGLKHLEETMSGYVERGEVPGLVTAVSRGAEARIAALGVRSAGAAGRQAVERDTTSVGETCGIRLNRECCREVGSQHAIE
jgi:hypothetical protein